MGYARVSTGSGEQLAALDNQIARLRAAGVEEVLQDVESGLSQERPAYLQLLGLIDRREVEQITVTRVDRLGRDAAATDAVLLTCARRGVRVHALDGGTVEVDTPQGFLLARIATSLAEVESRQLSLRIRRGFEQSRRKRLPSRGRAPWGYRHTSDRTALEVDPITGPLAREFLELLRRLDWRMNTALTQFQQPIPLHSCRAVKAWLLNPVLRGGLGYRQQANHLYAEIAWNCHEALLSHAEFERVVVQLDSNRRHWGVNHAVRPRLLTGLVRCGHCHLRMSYAGGRSIPAVVCRSRGCLQQYKSTHESTICLAINHALNARAEALAMLRKGPTPEEQALLSRIAALEALEDPDLRDAIEAKRRQLVAMQHSPARPELIKALSDPTVWHHATYEETRQLYQQLVLEVVVTKQEVEVVRLRV